MIPVCEIHSQIEDCSNAQTESFVPYSQMYDSYYCAECNKWLDEKCTDATCCYCSERPDKPKE